MRKNLLFALLLALVIVPAIVFVPSYAKGLNNRTLYLGTNIPDEFTTYTFSFDITDDTQPLGSISFEVCSNSALPEEPCVVPVGFDFSSSSFASQSGETGFALDLPSLSSNYLRLTRSPSIPVLQPVSYQFDNVRNPSDPNRTFYVRIATYPTSDASGTPTETGGVAASTSGQFTIGAYVPPFLEFCVGITITTNDCSTATGSLIDFGILRDTAPSVATSQLNGATNGSTGLIINVIGTTMTAGINAIDALTTPSVSVPGTNQFGINLRANSNPNAGAEPTGPGTTTAVGDYSLPDQFTFRPGDAVAISPLPTDYSTLTVTYLVNIDPNQPPGVYTSTITFVASTTF